MNTSIIYFEHIKSSPDFFDYKERKKRLEGLRLYFSSFCNHIQFKFIEPILKSEYAEIYDRNFINVDLVAFLKSKSLDDLSGTIIVDLIPQSQILDTSSIIEIHILHLNLSEEKVRSYINLRVFE
jgi:hypothetical protein